MTWRHRSVLCLTVRPDIVVKSDFMEVNEKAVGKYTGWKWWG